MSKQKTICVNKMLSPSSELAIFIYWTCNSKNNRLSYCGLVDAKIRASDKDLPVLFVQKFTAEIAFLRQILIRGDMSQPNILIPLVKISLSKLNSNGYGTELRKNCSSCISAILKLAI